MPSIVNDLNDKRFSSVQELVDDSTDEEEKLADVLTQNSTEMALKFGLRPKSLTRPLYGMDNHGMLQKLPP